MNDKNSQSRSNIFLSGALFAGLAFGAPAYALDLTVGEDQQGTIQISTMPEKVFGVTTAPQNGTAIIHGVDDYGWTYDMLYYRGHSNFNGTDQVT